VETVQAVISEYGTDLTIFPDEKQFVSHLQLAPWTVKPFRVSLVEPVAYLCSSYVDEGAEAYEKRYRQARLRRLASMATELGCQLAPLAVNA
jgi:hypothetical protein